MYFEALRRRILATAVAPFVFVGLFDVVFEVRRNSCHAASATTFMRIIQLIYGTLTIPASL